MNEEHVLPCSKKLTSCPYSWSDGVPMILSGVMSGEPFSTVYNVFLL